MTDAKACPFWGYHLMLDCGGLACDEAAMNDHATLKAFVRDVLEASHMTAWGDPVLARLDVSDGPGFPDDMSGTTVMQMLHTSSMVLHLCDKTRTLYFDLFSCKAFETDAIKVVIDRYFQPATTRVSFLTRQA